MDTDMPIQVRYFPKLFAAGVTNYVTAVDLEREDKSFN